jgi:hypothetical protein
MLSESLECISFGVTAKQLDASNLGDIFLEVRESLSSYEESGKSLSLDDWKMMADIYQMMVSSVAQFESPIEAGLMMGLDVPSAMMGGISIDFEKSEIEGFTMNPDCTRVDLQGLFEPIMDGPWSDLKTDYNYSHDWIAWYRFWMV